MGRLVLLSAVLVGLGAGIFFVVTDHEAPKMVFDLNNPQKPVLGVMTGGQPSEDDLRKLRDEGYGTVINLRLPEESAGFDEADLVEELGMTYISLPVDVRDGLTQANAAKLDQLVSDADGLTLVHCGSGDRVGALYALNGFYQNGMSVEDSIAFGKSAGLNRLEGAVRGVFSGDRN